MKTIVFLISSLTSSGGTQRMITLLSNLLVKNYIVKILVNNPGKSFFDLDSKVEIIHLNSKNVIRHNLIIYRILKSNKCSFFINLDSNSVLLNGLLIPFETKLIIWEHFSLVNNYNKLLYRLSRIYALLRAERFVLLSEFEINNWKKIYHLPKAKAKLIYNPITLHKEEITLNNKYSNKTVLALGNDITIKGFDILIESWSLISTDWKLIIVGVCEEQKHTLSKVLIQKNIKNVEIRLRTKDVASLYKEASVFVLPSRKEATPLVIIESQSYGIPAVVFNHLPGVLELVNNSALISDINDPIKSLYENLELIIRDESEYNRLYLNSLFNSERFQLQKFENEWLKILV